MIPDPEEQLFTDVVAASARSASNGDRFAGAARLHAGLLSAQRLAHAAAPWGQALVLEYGVAFADYLERNGLYTYAACQIGTQYSLDIQPLPARSGEPTAPRLITVLLEREVRVELGSGEEPLVHHSARRGGFTLMSAIELGWAYVLDDPAPDCSA